MKEFQHSQYAHCESGVLSALLNHHGLKMSEPMVFGISRTLSFVFFPMIKLNNMPLISYREVPKNIVKNLPKQLQLKMVKKKYKDPIQANQELGSLVNKGHLVGLQTSVFYLPYFPKDMRFHFNAHNLLVCSKKNSQYLISDPVFEEKNWCEESALTKARFAKGIFAPKGFLYFIEDIPKDIDLTPSIKKAIIKNAKRMLTPFPYVGIKGMRKLAKYIAELDSIDDERYVINYLTHIVRMQEEIGTGGGGFRYLYAAFLQEAKAYDLDQTKLTQASDLFTQSGEKLRQFALSCVQSCKHIENLNSKHIADQWMEIASIEERAFHLLKTL